MELFNCTDISFLEMILLIKNIMKIVEIIVILLLIISCTITIGKAVIAKDEEIMKIIKSCIPRFVTAIVIFFIPTITFLFTNYVSNDQSNIGQCYKNATKEYITAHKNPNSSTTDEDEFIDCPEGRVYNPDKYYSCPNIEIRE